MKASKFLLINLIVFFTISPVFSEILVVNSMDWKSVFLGMEYAHKMNYDIRFIRSPYQAESLARTLPKANVTILEMRDPILPGYSQYIRNMHGVYSSEMKFRDAADFQDFLMDTFKPKTVFFVSEAEPENAVISVPLAYKKNGLVFFQQDSLLRKLENTNAIYMVGNLRRDFSRSVSSISSVLNIIIEIVNSDSPYANSLKLLDMWGRTHQAILSSGDLLEKTLFESNMPILLVGTTNYGSEFLELLYRKNIDQVFLIGPKLLQVGQKIRDDSNQEIATLVKYGERAAESGVSEVIALTVYDIPLPVPVLNLTRVIYDPANKQVYVNIINLGDGISKTMGVHSIYSGNALVRTIRDDEPFTIWPGEEVTTSYSADLDDYALESLRAVLSARFGRYKDFMVNYIEVDIPVEIRTVMDRSEIQVTKATYDGNYLRISVENPGQVDTYVGGSAIIEIDGVPQEIPLPITRVEPGKSGILRTKVEMNKEDVDSNPFIKTLLRYGEASNLLTKRAEFLVQLDLVRINLSFFVLPVALLIIAFLAYLIYDHFRRRKYYRVSRKIKRISRKSMKPLSPFNRKKKSFRRKF